VTPPAQVTEPLWGPPNQLATVARNVITRYLVISTDAIIGLLLLPFNVHHLGTSAWGLWMLTASLNSYFSVLDLGYGGSITKFVAHYRARRDVESLNDILSTLFTLFSIMGVVAYVGFVIVAYHMTAVFNISAEQAETGRWLLLIAGTYVALGFPFGVFGGVMNGFQRYDINNIVGIGTSIVVAVANVVMLLAGYSLVQLVAVTTAIRLASYLLYRQNAYRVFPALSLRPSRFRVARLKELTGFSVYVSVIDWSNKLNYSIDALIIGAYLSPAAVALWSVPQRIAEFLQRLTNQLNGVLFPVIVDTDAAARPNHLRAIFIQGTRLSLFSVVPLAAALFMLARPLIHAWVGPQFDASVPIVQILVAVIAIRVGTATATTLLKGAGQHRMLAVTNAGGALTNVALSLLWIRRFGLIGQAFGTLVPITAVSLVVLWPAACRRVDISVADAFRVAVWPALWPLVAMAAAVLPLRRALPPTIASVALTSAIGGVLYAVTFFALAVPRDERRMYVLKLRQLMQERRRVPAAA
jgi:O-antigen/teichoic acid export membrane protein